MPFSGVNTLHTCLIYLLLYWHRNSMHMYGNQELSQSLFQDLMAKVLAASRNK